MNAVWAESENFGCFRKIAKSHYFVMSVRLFVCKNSVSDGRIFLKFAICVFFESLSRKFKFR